MKAYEGVFIFPPESAGDARKTQLKNLDDLIVKFQGSVIQKNEWGKKLLGYPLKKFREGYVVVTDFEMPSLQATEFRKSLELQEDLLKYMITIKVAVKPDKKAASAAAAPAVAAAPVAAVPQKTFRTPAPAGPAGASA